LQNILTSKNLAFGGKRFKDASYCVLHQMTMQNSFILICCRHNITSIGRIPLFPVEREVGFLWKVGVFFGVRLIFLQYGKVLLLYFYIEII